MNIVVVETLDKRSKQFFFSDSAEKLLHVESVCSVKEIAMRFLIVSCDVLFLFVGDSVVITYRYVLVPCNVQFFNVLVVRGLRRMLLLLLLSEKVRNLR